MSLEFKCSTGNGDSLIFHEHTSEPESYVFTIDEVEQKMYAQVVITREQALQIASIINKT